MPIVIPKIADFVTFEAIFSQVYSHEFFKNDSKPPQLKTGMNIEKELIDEVKSLIAQGHYRQASMLTKAPCLNGLESVKVLRDMAEFGRKQRRIDHENFLRGFSRIHFSPKDALYSLPSPQTRALNRMCAGISRTKLSKDEKFSRILGATAEFAVVNALSLYIEDSPDAVLKYGSPESKISGRNGAEAIFGETGRNVIFRGDFDPVEIDAYVRFQQLFDEFDVKAGPNNHFTGDHLNRAKQGGHVFHGRPVDTIEINVGPDNHSGLEVLGNRHYRVNLTKYWPLVRLARKMANYHMG